MSVWNVQTLGSMIRSTKPYAASTVRLFLCLVVLFAAAGCVIDVADPGELEPVNPSRRIMAVTMPPCHTALASFDGTTAYSNGSYTGTGSSCGGSAASGLRYQCPEVVMRHFMAKWGFRWWGNAKDLLANAPKAKTDVYYNGDAAHPPVPGDALVWTTGSYGHVALISSTTTTSVSIIEQNWAGNGTATFAYANGTIASRGSGWVPAGWVHAKANTGNGQPGPQPPPPPPPPPPPVNWTCNQSSYQGQQVWTCSGGTLYRCENGTPVKKDCPSGCNTNPLGVNDTCKNTTPPPASANQQPTGWLQVADCNGITGWAQDPDGASATVDVRIRIDQSAPIVVKANESRPELCTQLGSCSHGYALPLPVQFRDGKQHTVQVEALDLGSGPAALLKGSPKTFTCSSTAPSSPPPSTSPNDDLPDPGTNGSGASAESITGGCNLASSPADGGWTVLALLLLVVLRRRTHPGPIPPAH